MESFDAISFFFVDRPVGGISLTENVTAITKRGEGDHDMKLFCGISTNSFFQRTGRCFAGCVAKNESNSDRCTQKTKEACVKIKDSEFIKTSFPNFINLFNSLGGNLTE